MAAPGDARMTDPVDDRRRFRELWKEILFVRMAASLLTATVAFWVVALLVVNWVVYMDDALQGIGAPAGAECYFWSFVLVWASLPSALSTREKAVHWLLPGMTFVALAVAFAATITSTGEQPPPWILLGTLGAALGLGEGLLQRSVSTAYGGLLGGLLVGAATGYASAGVLCSTLTAPYRLALDMAVAVAIFVSLQLGIGLSLALGRWLRDGPKKESEAAG